MGLTDLLACFTATFALSAKTVSAGSRRIAEQKHAIIRSGLLFNQSTYFFSFFDVTARTCKTSCLVLQAHRFRTSLPSSFDFNQAYLTLLCITSGLLTLSIFHSRIKANCPLLTARPIRKACALNSFELGRIPRCQVDGQTSASWWLGCCALPILLYPMPPCYPPLQKNPPPSIGIN